MKKAQRKTGKVMNILTRTFAEFSVEFHFQSIAGSRSAAQIYHAVYKKGDLTGFDETKTAISGLLKIVQDQEVQKVATTLLDGSIIESVIIPGPRRTTLCVSSQVGCRWGCVFCATGKNGFARNLSTHEIVAQVFNARFTLGCSINNIVFMGMGEPLDNFDNVIQAIRVISDQRGFNIPLSRITLSTAGHADGVALLAAQNMPRLRLALSLHAGDDEVRNRLMPMNRRFPLAELKKKLREYPLCKRGVFLIEYVVIAGINDSREAAGKLAEFLKDLPTRVNLIAFNPHPDLPYHAPDDDALKQFRQWLIEKGIFVRIRRSRGCGIMAACGQLAGDRPSEIAARVM